MHLGSLRVLTFVHVSTEHILDSTTRGSLEELQRGTD